MNLAEWLPFNRKERFFTGTVLPGIIAADGFSRLDRFLALCGLPNVLAADPAERVSEVQFLTEYGFAESAPFDPSETWSHYEGGRDTPDVVIAGPSWLLAVEAKLYARQGAQAIDKQLATQAGLIAHWAGVLHLSGEQTRLVALLPGAYAADLTLSHPVVTWEQVLSAYSDLADDHWYQVLATAMARYDALKSTFDAGDALRMTGAEIFEQGADDSFEFKWVGRRGGLNGQKFEHDLASGSWRSQPYEVRNDPPAPGNPNWMTLADFLNAAAAA